MTFGIAQVSFLNSPEERGNCRLLGVCEWPDLDEHISVEGLLAGRCSGESQESLRRWLVSCRTAVVV